MKNFFFSLLLLCALLAGFLFTASQTSERGKELGDFIFSVFKDKTDKKNNTTKKQVKQNSKADSTKKELLLKKDRIKQKPKKTAQFVVITAPYAKLYIKEKKSYRAVATLFRGEQISIFTNIQKQNFIHCNYKGKKVLVSRKKTEIFNSYHEYHHFQHATRNYGYSSRYSCVYNTIRALKKRSRTLLVKGIHDGVTILFMDNKRKHFLSSADWRNLPSKEHIRRAIFGKPYTLGHIISRARTLYYRRSNISKAKNGFLYPKRGNLQLRFIRIGSRWFWESIILWEHPVD